MEGFLCCRLVGLIFGGASTWRGLFSEFYGIFGTGQTSILAQSMLFIQKN